jgi:hypothetical protein
VLEGTTSLHQRCMARSREDEWHQDAMYCSGMLSYKCSAAACSHGICARSRLRRRQHQWCHRPCSVLVVQPTSCFCVSRPLPMLLSLFSSPAARVHRGERSSRLCCVLKYAHLAYRSRFSSFMLGTWTATSGGARAGRRCRVLLCTCCWAAWG